MLLISKKWQSQVMSGFCKLVGKNSVESSKPVCTPRVSPSADSRGSTAQHKPESSKALDRGQTISGRVICAGLWPMTRRNREVFERHGYARSHCATKSVICAGPNVRMVM